MFSEVGIAVTAFLCERPISGAFRDEVILRVTVAFFFFFTFQALGHSSEFSIALSSSR